MRGFFTLLTGISTLCWLASFANAQGTSVNQQSENASTGEKAEASKQISKSDESKIKPPPAKKMIQDATINLQTTITGNQEQPRVLYILPWQSPQTEDVDFEPLDNQQKAVFGHIEREELRRELESSGDLQ